MDKLKLREFGLVMAVALNLLNLFLLLRKGEVSVSVIFFSALFLFFSFASPDILKPLYKIWTALSIILSRITNVIILTAIFYLVLLPTGLAVKLFKGDFFGLKFDKKKGGSFWETKTKTASDKKYYERQF